jgi:hypothetical protein
LLFEELNLLKGSDGKKFEDYYASILVPCAPHFRNIRIDLDVIFDKDCIRVLKLCQNAGSLALYNDRYFPELDDDGAWIKAMGDTVGRLLEEGRLDTLGFYGNVIESIGLLHSIPSDSKARKALKRLDLHTYYMSLETYDMVRSQFPSLESFTISYGIRHPHDPIWAPSQRSKWEPYSNLTRLQFLQCGRVYCNQVAHLVRHFPSLKYLLVSTCDDGGDICRTDSNIDKGERWYDRKDALWRVRKPLETLHLEHMLEWEITAMGDIPTKELVVTNLKGNFLTESMMKDPRIFPALQTIRIQPAIIPEYAEGIHPFDNDMLVALEKVCKERQLVVLRDAEATMLFPRHHY